MKKLKLWIGSMMLAATALVQAQETPKLLINESFQEDTGGWLAVGPNAKLALYVDASISAPTPGALRLRYAVEKDQFNLAILSTSADKMKDAKSIRLQARADADTTIGIVLTEEDGGRYTAFAHVPRDKWQKIELSIYDFALATDASDPKDPNGKLDLDRVNAVAVVDFAQFLAQIGTGPLADVVKIEKGTHTLYMDDFQVSTEALPPSTASQGEDLQIDGFTHPQVGWLSVGGVKLSRAGDGPIGASAMRAEYSHAPGMPIILSRSLNPWVLTQAKTLTFSAAASKASQIMVQVEETGGGKYQALVSLPAEATKATEIKLSFADFKPSDDSKDGNGKLDLSQVKSLSFVDATGLMGGEAGKSTLWIGKLMALSS